MPTLTSTRDLNILSVGARLRRDQMAWWLWFSGLMALTALAGLYVLRNGTTTAILALPALFVFLAGAAIILYQPRFGLYVALFLTLAGDAILMPWFPFVKNFSSRESLLFIHDALIISPLEATLIFIFISWLGGAAMQRKVTFYRGDLFWPAVVFLAFVLMGLIFGIGSGGNVNIGLWEARPIFYMVAMLILTSNLLTKREHVSHLIWAAMFGLLVEGVVGSNYYLFRLNGNLAGVQAITEHSAALHMNTLFVLAAASWSYGASTSKRFAWSLFIPVVGMTYLATQRRAAFVTLGIALILLVGVLYRDRRRLFWYVVPPAAALALVYTAVFWNSGSALGMPVQAFKAVVAPEQASAADASSDIYRQLENVNLTYTIRSRLLTGVGFGQKFLIIVPMPDISWFDWWDYMPHNSIIWVWLKTGVGGFLAMLVLVGSSVMLGGRVIRRMPTSDLRVIAITATLYLIMHFIYAYVDLSWDAQSMVYVGTMMGVLNRLEYIAGQPVQERRKRWRWQPEPMKEPGLLS